MAFYVIPRLPKSVALSILGEMRATVEAAGDIKALVGLEHPLASPVPTGGTLAPPEHLKEVHKVVHAALEEVLSPQGVLPNRASSTLNRFDAVLGRSLHGALQILPADAANEGTWSFLSCVVFPDLVHERFPDLHESRVVGGGRNALRRAWQRYEVLGELLSTGNLPLQEDEIVQITERTALARNHRLARLITRGVVGHEHAQRTLCTRYCVANVMRITGPLMLDVYDDEALSDLVGVAMESGHARWAAESDGDERAPAESAQMPEASREPSPQTSGQVTLQEPVEATIPRSALVSAQADVEVPVDDKFLSPGGPDRRPAWHPDPWGLARLRWWDGRQWTADTAR